MAKSEHGGTRCQICGSARRLTPGALVRNGVVEEILKVHPAWSGEGFICQDDLDHFRIHYIETILSAEKGELSTLERDVIDSIQRQEILASDSDREFECELTFGERLADRVAAVGGSWIFIVCFSFFILFWIGLNSLQLIRHPFDPFPYILLNLILSCLAAVQAPIIMMSQNRQEAKDRLRSQSDYRVNLKAELEIRHLHEKIDHLLTRQWERLVEIQRIQLELMSELTQRKK